MHITRRHQWLRDLQGLRSDGHRLGDDLVGIMIFILVIVGPVADAKLTVVRFAAKLFG